MQLTTILLIIVSILVFLTGILFVVGSINKKERKRAIWVLLATIGSMIWSISTGLLSLDIEKGTNISAWTTYFVCLGALMAGIGLLGYCLSYHKIGKIITRITLVFGLILALVGVVIEPQLLLDIYAGRINWFYICFGGLTSFVFIAAIIGAAVRARTMTNKRAKKSATFFLVGLILASAISLTCNMIFPFGLGIFKFLWIGPLSNFFLILAFYLSLFGSHSLIVKSIWFKILSYIVVAASCAIIYMILFFLIFTAIFRVATPTSSVILLNFVMVIVVLLLIPAINEVSSFIKSLISVDQIDVGYILKKLKRVDSKKVNLQELAEFLGNHLHLAYFGVVINGRLYESEDSSLDAQTLKAINALKPTKHNVWHDLNNAHGQIIKNQKIIAVADLYNDKDEVIGQALIGKPINERRFSRREFIQLESVVNMVAIIVAPKKHKRK